MKRRVKKTGTVVILVIALLMGTMDVSLFQSETNTYAESAKGKDGDQTEAADKGKETWTEIEDKKVQDAAFFTAANGKNKVNLYTNEIRFTNPKNNKWVNYSSFLIPVKEKKTELYADVSGYYENKKSDKKYYMPENYQEGHPLIGEYKNIQLSRIPLDNTGEAIQTKAKDTKTTEDTVKDLSGEEQTGIRTITYPATEADYQYDALPEGFKETIIFPEGTKDYTRTFTLTVSNAYLKADGRDITEKEAVFGKEVRLFGSDNQPVGSLTPITISSVRQKEAISHGVYSLILLKEKTKGKETTRTYQLTIGQEMTSSDGVESDSSGEVVSSEDISNEPIQIESSFLWGDPDSESAATDQANSEPLMFEGMEEYLQNKYIQKANLYLTESEDSQEDTTYRLYREDMSSSAGQEEVETVSEGAIEGENPTSREPEGSVTTDGEADTVKSIDVTDYVMDVMSGNVGNDGLYLVGQAESEEEIGIEDVFVWEDSEELLTRPMLSVVYYDEPNLPMMDLNQVYHKKGEDTELTWWEATAHSFDYIQYRMALLHKNKQEEEQKEIMPYSSATKLGVGEDGKVTIPTSGLAEGSYRISVRSVDTQGNYSKENATILTIDGTNPKLKKVSLTPATSGIEPKNASPTITWRDIKESHLEKVEYSVNGGAYTTAGESVEGSFTIGSVAFTSEKENIIRVRAVDRAGNLSEEHKYAYYYDDTKPRIKNLSLNESSPEKFAEKPAVITYEIEENSLREVLFCVNGEEWKKIGGAKSGSYTIPASYFSETNEYHIGFQVIDQAGNSEYQAVSYFYAKDSEDIPEVGLPTAEPQASEVSFPNIEEEQSSESVLPIAEQPTVKIRALAATTSTKMTPNRLGRKPHLSYVDFSTEIPAAA
ncbi:MAG: hypothetical protein LBR68_01285 [Lachnoclostridium sp.]|nr:hypothetical protein [Lachnoclostridium sp.]